MVKGKTSFLVMIGIIIIAAAFLLPLETKEKDFIEVRLYDADGNMIGTTETFATVNDVPNVASVDFVITVTNIGDLSLDAKYVGLVVSSDYAPETKRSEAQGLFANALLILINDVKTIQPGQSAQWISDKMDVDSIAGYTYEFTVYYQGEWIGGMDQKAGTVTLSIEPSGIGDFEISVSTGIGDSGTPEQTVIFRTNANSLTAYDQVGTWIAFDFWNRGDLIGFERKTATLSQCFLNNKIMDILYGTYIFEYNDNVYICVNGGGRRYDPTQIAETSTNPLEAYSGREIYA